MSLRFGAMLIVYKQEEYVEYCIRAVAPYVDSVLVLFSEYPFIAYNPRARQMFSEPDATRSILETLKAQVEHLTVVEGIWDAEELMRNDGLIRLRNMGVEACLIIDADEMYPDGALTLLKEEVVRTANPGTVFRARYRNCFRRLDYVIDSPKLRMPVAVHIAPDTVFVNGRAPTGPAINLPENIFYWHFGYVLSDERMWEKINTFSHSSEILNGWYESKWLQWSPRTIDLSRKNPANKWPIAKRIDLNLLPEIMCTHPFYIEAQDNPL